MSTPMNRDARSFGLMSEGLSLALIYAIALVTTWALQGSRIDGLKLLLPAVAFAALGGWLLPRFEQHRPVLLGLVAAAAVAGIAIGVS